MSVINDDAAGAAAATVPADVGDSGSPPPGLQTDGITDYERSFYDHHRVEHEPLATELKPLEDATLTVRVIKSFAFRTTKNLVLRGVDLRKMTVGGLIERVKEDLKTAPGFKAYRNLDADTLKLYTVAHGHKTMNLIINLDHDEWILSDLDRTLEQIGAQNETELSFFNRAAYEEFKSNPETKWD